jgi:hypothetical protein
VVILAALCTIRADMAMVISNADHDESRRLAALSHLLRELEDVSANIPCLFVILGLLVDVFGDMFLDEWLILTHCYDHAPHIPDEMMTVAFRWLTAPRTTSERNNLFRSSTSCNCPDTHQQEKSHRRITQKYRSSSHQSPLSLLVQVLCNIIGVGLTDGGGDSPSSKSQMRVIVSGKRLIWPTKIEQVLPWGPEDTTRGLLGWFISGLGPYFPVHLLRMTDKYLYFTHPKTIGYLLTSRAFVPGAVLGGLTQARTIYRKNDIRDKSLNDFIIFGTVLTTSVRLIFRVVRERINETQRKALLQAYSTQLIVVYDQLLVIRDEIGSRSNMPTVVNESFVQLDFMGGLLLTDFPDMSVPSLLVFLPGSQFPQTVWQRFILALQCTTWSYRCASPHCLNTDADVPALRTCGQCRRVSYCSRQCQRRSWSHPVAPHRLICAKLRQICEAYGVPRRNPRDLINVHVNVTPRNYDEHLSITIGIVDALSAQTKYELETSRTCPGFLLVVACAHYISSAMYRSEEEWNANLVARNRSVKELITPSTTV